MKETYDVTVGRLITRIRDILHSTVKMDKVWVHGEISNLTKHRNGQYYFFFFFYTASIRCVMFSSSVKALQLDVNEGDKVAIQGRVELYVERGDLQLIVKTIRPEGLGQLYLEFEARKKRLVQGGYFDQNHKKPKPDVIGDIGIITAKEGAAIQDVLKTLHHRWPMMKIQLYPSLVQGNNAPASIIEQLKIADQNNHDAILLVRGGGSFEDLFCFSDEQLVHTIYDCQTYIVSGVGHETDTTLSDLVADHRAVTPTAAAQWVSLDQYEQKEKIHTYQKLMKSMMDHQIERASQQLDKYQSHPYLQEPMAWVMSKRLKLDSIETQMEERKHKIIDQKNSLISINKQLTLLLKQVLDTNSIKYQLTNKHLFQSFDQYRKIQNDQLMNKMQLLDAYSPLKTLLRGYTVTRSGGKMISSIDQIQVDATIETRVKDGIITSKVIKKEKDHE